MLADDGLDFELVRAFNVRDCKFINEENSLKRKSRT